MGSAAGTIDVGARSCAAARDVFEGAQGREEATARRWRWSAASEVERAKEKPLSWAHHNTEFGKDGWRLITMYITCAYYT